MIKREESVTPFSFVALFHRRPVSFSLLVHAQNIVWSFSNHCQVSSLLFFGYATAAPSFPSPHPNANGNTRLLFGRKFMRLLFDMHGQGGFTHPWLLIKLFVSFSLCLFWAETFWINYSLFYCISFHYFLLFHTFKYTRPNINSISFCSNLSTLVGLIRFYATEPFPFIVVGAKWNDDYCVAVERIRYCRICVVQCIDESIWRSVNENPTLVFCLFEGIQPTFTFFRALTQTGYLFYCTVGVVIECFCAFYF